MKDRLHWSFGDGNTLRELIFPQGFSAEQSTLPRGSFDPAGEWENAYDFVYTRAGNPKQPAHVYYGSLRLRMTRNDGKAHLQAIAKRQTRQHFDFERMTVRATFTCTDEPLLPLSEGTPWTLETELVNQRDPATGDYAEFREEGRLNGENVEKKDDRGEWYRYRQCTAGLPLVSDWALMAAVQTLPRDCTTRFDLLRQLESFYPEQRVRYLESFDARFGDREVALHGFVHTGQGTVPSFYWVDHTGRLLIVRTALGAFVYNPSPYLESVAS